ncbi:MAG: glycosyl hydrolase 53 family protein [Clostridiaceae bacterium]|nr:glycosyl hydrolase 53 family protein [Clostridiaceae bacterium]
MKVRGKGKAVIRSWRKCAALLMAFCMVVTFSVTNVYADDGSDTESDYSVKIEAADADGNALTAGDDGAYSSVAAGDTITLKATVTNGSGEEITDLSDAELYLWWYGSDSDASLWDANAGLAYSDYDDNSGHSFSVNVTFSNSGSYLLYAEIQDSSWNDITVESVAVSVSEADTSDYVEADIDVTPVSGLSDEFVMGVDISSVISELDSGVKYYDYDGNEITTVDDFCQLLADSGVTHVRVRVWNDPYDSEGNGYGGGNCDVTNAAAIAAACQKAGLSMLIDFHFSDFWADPGRQLEPKAWEDYSLDEKKTAMGSFVSESLTTIAETGAEIDMVQIGNETTNAFVGVSRTTASGEENPDFYALFQAGSEAVASFNQDNSDDIKVVIHVTNPESGSMSEMAYSLDANSVDYDILATSYYPFWHGTLDNLKSEMENVKSTYGKDVMVAETSYPFTLEDTDGHDNNIREGSGDTGMDYSFSVQGQANSVRDVIDTVNAAGGIGMFYWEPAWITVGDTTGLSGDEYDTQVDANKVLWEQYGSGWASSYAAAYDPDNVGEWYGGSSWDNQAMFTASGTPLSTLKIWQYVKTGAYTNAVTYEAVEASAETITLGSDYTLPDTVTVTYNKGTRAEAVTWNATEAAAIDSSAVGTYVVTGTVTLNPEESWSADDDYDCSSVPSAVETTFTLTVKAKNLIENAADAGFESGEHFTLSDSDVLSVPSSSDPYEGDYGMHWWNPSSENAVTATVTYDQAIKLKAGTYVFEAVGQGIAGDTVTLSVLDESKTAIAAGEALTLTGWNEWGTASVEFTLEETASVYLAVLIGAQPSGWGTVDNMYLYTYDENAGLYTELDDENGDDTGDGTGDDTGTNNGDGTGDNSGNDTGSTTEVHAEAITLSETSVTLEKGKTQTLTATVTPAGSVDGTVTWSSADSDTATVTDGVVTAVKAGTTTITAETAGGLKAACQVTVTVAASKVYVNKTVTIKKGKTAALTATVMPTDSTDTLTWTSSNKKVATVTSKGKVKAVKKGNATITVKTSSGKKAACKVTVVNKKAAAKSIKLNKSKASLKAGGVMQLKATITKGSTDTVKWSSSKPSVAKVAKNGVVTGLKAGTAKITVKTSSGKKAVCTITVKK